MRKSFPHYTQFDAMDCGPTCLRMIAKYYGRSYTLSELRKRSFLTKEGVSMLGISDAAEMIGFRTQGVRVTLEQLINDVPTPCILHWNQNHFVVCYRIRHTNKGRFFTSKDKENECRFYISDPAQGKAVFTKEELEKCWISTTHNNENKGTVLILYPTPAFMMMMCMRETGMRRSGK